MKRLLISVITALIGIALFADEPRIHDIQIKCRLDSLGSAHIEETWTVHTVQGTEWYLVRENLGDIEIKDLHVWENGEEFLNEGRWDVDRSLSQKAGRCGIHPTSRGCEICWGIGSYDDHTFVVNYTMTNAVKSFYDYDMLHLQFISDELSTTPEHARVSIEIPGVQLDTTNARIWGFGYEGTTAFEDGALTGESTERFRRSSSMILLARFEKGVIAEPQSMMDGSFVEHLERALDGASFKDDENEDLNLFEKIIVGIVVFFTVFFQGGWILLLPPYLIYGIFHSRKKYLGTYKKKDVPWSREIPFNGDLATANYALGQFNEAGKNNSIASAMILQMIREGAIIVKSDGKDGGVELLFSDKASLEYFDKHTQDLWMMMRNASGNDQILQEKEFSTWANKHKSTVSNWADGIEKAGKKSFEDGIWCTKGSVNDIGREECRRAYGLKKFLTEFTLLKERTSKEAVLWDNYIVYAALFGVAEKVAEELKDIDPSMYEQLQAYDPGTLHNVLYMSNRLSRAITSASNDYKASQTSSGSHGSRGGYGGHSSFGGGGGFSGGGHGGGCR